MVDNDKRSGRFKPPGGQTGVNWDDANARSHRPRVLNVFGGREEIILALGGDQASDTGQDADSYRFSDRIVMSPFTAKRLLITLNHIISDYESKYGSLDLKSPPSIAPGEDSPPPAGASRSRISDQKNGLSASTCKRSKRRSRSGAVFQGFRQDAFRQSIFAGKQQEGHWTRTRGENTGCL